MLIYNTYCLNMHKSEFKKNSSKNGGIKLQEFLSYITFTV